MNASKVIDGQKVYNPWLVAVVVSLATFMEVLDTTITNVSLTHIAGSLAASRDESTWVLTSYLVANGIVLPLSGWLSNVIGRKRFFLICIAGFTASSLLCGLATSLPMLIVCRLLQGLAGGGLQPTQQAIILDSFPPEKRGTVFGIVGMTLIFAPVLGPTLGGWITDNFNWRWIFYINVPVGLLAMFLVHLMVRDPDHATAQGTGKIDYIGLSFVVLSLGALQIVLDKGQQEDWFADSTITMLAVISASATIAGIFWLLRQKEPIIDLSLFKDRSYALGTILIFITGFVLYSSTALLPILVQSHFGYDALTAGLVLSPAAVFVMFLMPVSGKLVSKVPSKYLAMMGMGFGAIGFTAGALSMNPNLSYEHFVWLRSLQMMGIPFLFIPVSTLAFIHIPKEKSTRASSMFSLARNLGGSFGIALVTTVLARKAQVHQTHLIDRLVPGDPVYDAAIENITATGIAHGLDPVSAARNATATIYSELLNQASLIAYQDCFVFLAVLAAAGVLMAFMLPTNDPAMKTELSAAH